MKITFLGTGTSQGIPVIGCKCAACLSSDPRDRRYRTSLHISHEKTSVVIDTGPDFRMQMLDNAIDNLDAVIFTHEHNDHIIGLDDLRPFFFRHKGNFPLFAEQRVINDLKIRFEYAFRGKNYPGIPQFDIHPIYENEVFKIGAISIEPIRVKHGKLPVFGFKIANFCYITDANYISEFEKNKLKNIDFLVINALHHKKHYSHYNLKEALDLIKELKVKKAYLTHLSHTMGPIASIENELPKNVKVAHDGLSIELFPFLSDDISLNA